MARNGIKSGGRDWKPGQSGNPLGAKALPPEVKQARKLNLAEFTATVEKYRHMSLEQLKAAKADPHTTVWDLCIIGWLSQGWSDHRATAALMERFLGKVPDKVHMSGTLAQYKAPGGDTTEFGIRDTEEGE